MKKIYADNRMTLNIGRQGENLARLIIFDLSDWMAEYGPGDNNGSIEVIR